jgi:hypothetical protein
MVAKGHRRYRTTASRGTRVRGGRTLTPQRHDYATDLSRKPGPAQGLQLGGSTVSHLKGRLGWSESPGPGIRTCHLPVPRKVQSGQSGHSANTLRESKSCC